MAIKLIANYSKRLGLPGYSSHQFSVSVEAELMTSDDIPAESERLYQLLQTNVDQQILNTGFVPPADYGMDPPSGPPSSFDKKAPNHIPAAGWKRSGIWKCSDKQRDLILKLVDEHQLEKAAVEALAIERFGKGVRQLNKVEASGLIDEMIDTHSETRSPGSKREGRNPRQSAQERKAA